MGTPVTLHRLSVSIMDSRNGYEVRVHREVCEANKGKSVFSIPREVRHKRLPIGDLMKPLESFTGCFVIWYYPQDEANAKILIRDHMEKWVNQKLEKAQAMHHAWTHRNDPKPSGEKLTG